MAPTVAATAGDALGEVLVLAIQMETGVVGAIERFDEVRRSDRTAFGVYLEARRLLGQVECGHTLCSEIAALGWI